MYKLKESLKNFYNDKIFTSIMIFPEGITTSNRQILKFKRGVFSSYLLNQWWLKEILIIIFIFAMEIVSFY